MASSGIVTYERSRHLATITMNRPERLNAYSPDMADALAWAWNDGISDSEVRVVILTGAGRIFCAGRDLKAEAERAGAPIPPSSAPRVAGFQLVPDTDKPIVTAVRGGAWGAGLYMVCGSDIAVVAEDAVFAFSSVPTGALGSALVPKMNQLPWLPGLS